MWLQQRPVRRRDFNCDRDRGPTAGNGDQVAVTLVRIPAHSDFEQGIARHHEETEEVSLVGR
jgi:hypothetical protein